MRRGGNWGADPRSLDAQQREQLEENLTIVLGYWFRDKMNRYFEQRPERRAAWLDRENPFESGGTPRGMFPSPSSPWFSRPAQRSSV